MSRQCPLCKQLVRIRFYQVDDMVVLRLLYLLDENLNSELDMQCFFPWLKLPFLSFECRIIFVAFPICYIFEALSFSNVFNHFVCFTWIMAYGQAFFMQAYICFNEILIIDPNLNASNLKVFVYQRVLIINLFFS